MELKQILVGVMLCTVYENCHAQSCDVSHIPELTLRVASPYNKGSSEETYYLVGFFPAKLKSLYNRSGFVWIEAAKFAFRELMEMYRQKGLSINLELLIYDTCNKIEIASMEMLDLLLQSAKKKTFSDCCSKDLSNNVIGLIGPASSSTTNQLLKLLSSDQYPVIGYSATSVRFNDKTLYPTFMRTIPPDDLQARLMLDIVIKYNWNYVSIVAQDNEYGRMGMDELRKLFVQHEICTSIETVFDPNDKRDIGQVLEQIDNDPLSNVIILWASGVSTQKFLKETQKYKLHHKTLILGESVNENPSVLTYDHRVVHGSFSIVPNSGVYTAFEENFKNMSYIEHSPSNPWLKAFFEDYVKLTGSTLNQTLIKDYWAKLPMTKNGNIYNAVFAYGQAIEDFIERNLHLCSKISSSNCLRALVKDRMNFTKNYLRKVEFNDLQQRPTTFDKEGNMNSTEYTISSPQFIGGRLQWKRVGKWNKNTGLQMTQTFLWPSNETVVPLSRCGSACKSGYAHRAGSKECCWQCIPCQGNSVKINAGKGLCTYCPKGTYTNKEHTICLSLKQIYIDHLHPMGIILLSTCLLNTFIIIFFAVVFITYRKTPVVISSQMTLSLLQFLFLGLLNFTILPSFNKTDRTKCMIYGTITPFIVILAIAPTILKIHRVVTVFNAKGILRHKKYVLSKDIFKIISLVALQAVIVAISFVFNPYRETSTQIDVDLLEIRIGCKFKLLFYMEIVYLLLILLVCGFAAFRARELPTNYNETRVIAYAMFMCSVILIFVFPLYLSTSDVMARSLITNFTFLLIDFTIVTFMYSPKIWIILFRPKMNTSEYFTRERMRKVTNDVTKSMYDKQFSVTPTSTRSLIVSDLPSYGTGSPTFSPMVICKGRTISFLADNEVFENDETPRATPLIGDKFLTVDTARKKESLTILSPPPRPVNSDKDNVADNEHAYDNPTIDMMY